MLKTNLTHHLEAAQRAFRQGMQARADGRPEQARSCLLQASELLFLAAAGSPPGLRENRTRLAERLLDEARSLANTAPQPAKKSVGRKNPLPAGDETEDTWLVREKPDVTFDQIAGLADVKEQIRLRLLYPFTHPELAAAYGINPGGGLLLYGPPGTGKTMIARAIAGEIQAAFFAIKPSEIMSKWVGEAEGNLARLFNEAESHPVSVIFIDELESLTPKRRSTNSSVMARVVPQLLAELDGFKKRTHTLLLVGATNEPWSIDSAILRPGRLDRLIYVSPPDQPARRRILELNLDEQLLAEDAQDLESIAARTQGFSGADMVSLAVRVRTRVFFTAIHRAEVLPIRMADFEAELADMRASIPQKDLKLFERFARGESLSPRHR